MVNKRIQWNAGTRCFFIISSVAASTDAGRYALKNMKKYPGLYIIAIYFLMNGVGGFYQILPSIFEGNLTPEIYPSLIFNIGFLIAGIGLIGCKGWGRNFALLFNGVSIIVGLKHFLIYFYGDAPDSRSIVKGIADFIIAGLIYQYLLKAKIKTIFSPSPISWCILGLFLLLFSMNQHTGNSIVDTFWAIIMIFGLAISGYGAKQLRKNTPQHPLGYE